MNTRNPVDTFARVQTIARPRVVAKRMNVRRPPGGFVFAGLLGCALCAGGAAVAAAEPEPPPPPPPVLTETPRAEEPGAQQRERFRAWRERLREIGGEGDYSGFAEEAEREAERRREEALRRGAAARARGVSALEEEMFQQTLREAGLLNEAGCFKSAPDFSQQRDLFRYQTLTRGDFQKRESARGPEFAPGERPDAALFLVLGCTFEVFVEETAPAQFTARMLRAEIFALGSRARSRWNPARGRRAQSVLEHQQGHFDLAHRVAEDWRERFQKGRIALHGEARNPTSARGLLELRWAAQLDAARAELRALAKKYDADTRYGADADAQQRWRERIARGLDNLREERARER